MPYPLNLPVEKVIEHQGDAKYIIVGLYEVGYGKGSSSTLTGYALVTIDLYYHSDIFAEYEERLMEDEELNLKPQVLGGGIITIDANKKHVRTYGTSGGYGSPPMELLQYVIERSFPDYSRDVTITKYIRG